MILEVIATNASEAKMAEQSGADRIELITTMLEGGLTPSYGCIEEVVNAVSIPVQVMVRPHSMSFSYNDADLRTMCKDVQMIKRLGATGVVVGMLNSEKEIDTKSLERILEVAGELDITFHRAFDEVKDQEEALTTLKQYPQIKRILTSGGKQSAWEALGRIEHLVSLTQHSSLTIMAGSGLKVDTIQEFVARTGVKEVHFGTGVRRNQQALEPIDPERVRRLKSRIQQMRS